MMITKELGEKAKLLKKYKYVLLILLVGAALIMLPTGSSEAGEAGQGQEDIGVPLFSVHDEEARLEEAIGRIEGVGEVRVLLSLKGSVERELALDGDETLVISAGSGNQRAVARRYVYPEYLGALVICGGGGDAGVKLDVTRAVGALTGLTSDKITVIKMKK